MNRIVTALAAVTFAFAATFAQAQTPRPEGMDRGQMRDGDKGQMRDGHRGKMREGMRAAREACKGQPDRRACMMETICPKAADPAKCQARFKERGQRAQKRMDDRQKAHEACNGRRGEDLGVCLRDQREKLGLGHHRRG